MENIGNKNYGTFLMSVTNHFLQRHWHCFVNSYFLNYFRNIFFCLRFINDLIVKLIHKRCVVSLNKSHCRFRKFAVLIFASIAVYTRIFIHHNFDFRRSSFMRSSKLKNRWLFLGPTLKVQSQ